MDVDECPRYGGNCFPSPHDHILEQ